MIKKYFENYFEKIKDTKKVAREKNINGLELDHIEGGGSKRRKELGADGGWNYMAKLKKLNFPSGYQVLCATCNKIKQIEIDPK